MHSQCTSALPHLDLHVDLPICKALDLDLPQLNTQVVCNLHGQRLQAAAMMVVGSDNDGVIDARGLQGGMQASHELNTRLSKPRNIQCMQNKCQYKFDKQTHAENTLWRMRTLKHDEKIQQGPRGLW